MVENKYQIRIIFYKLYGMSIHPKRKTKGKKKKKIIITNMMRLA